VLYLLALKNLSFAVFAMVFCIAFRPVTAVLWAVWGLSQSFKTLWKLLVVAIWSGGLTILMDSLFFQTIVFTPLNFFLFNFSSATHYGTHPFYWYFSSGIPTLTLTYFPLILSGIWHSANFSQAPKWPFFAFFGAFPLFFSVVPHKEFRFLLSSLSVGLLYSGSAFERLFRWRQKKGRFLLFFLISINLGAAVYFSIWHQRGPIAVSDHLRKTLQNKSKNVCFLTPCHSLPGYARFHGTEISLKSLECDPPQDGRASRESQSDAFFKQVPQLIDAQLAVWQCDLVVGFEPLFDLLTHRGWTKTYESFHAHFPSDSRHGKKVAVFSRSLK
jgi:phosphatidylinositol glycan class B